MRHQVREHHARLGARLEALRIDAPPGRHAYAFATTGGVTTLGALELGGGIAAKQIIGFDVREQTPLGTFEFDRRRARNPGTRDTIIIVGCAPHVRPEPPGSPNLCLIRVYNRRGAQIKVARPVLPGRASGKGSPR